MSTAERTSAPPLWAGQRLHQPEFHARYHAMPPGTRAELIGGVVVMPSPLGNPHGIVDAAATLWLGVYKSRTPGTEASANAHDHPRRRRGSPRPTGWLRIKPSARAARAAMSASTSPRRPELIVEVADSSRSIDLGAKLAEYERAGALEYVVFALDPDEVFWHARQGDRLVRVGPGPDGIYRSQAFPGLWLDPVALFADDGPSLLATLDRGLASPEHAAFVAYLAGR